ncbi:MAG: FtsX-like permease family protein [Pyrinomonadaceae bacterium]
MTGGLGLVTLRQWQLHKLRLVLTVLGIALGVAVFFAVRSTNRTLVDSLNATVQQLAGKATLQVTAGEAGFSGDIITTVRTTPGVADAEPVTETIANTLAPANEKLLILGLDTSSDLKIYSDMFDEGDFVVKNPLAFSSRSDSIAVTRKFAERFSLADDSKLRLQTSAGEMEFTVRGLFKSEGAGEIFDGNVAVMDIAAAQEVFGKIGKLDRIDLMTDPDAEIDTVAENISAKLPAGIKVVRPNIRGQALENTVSSMHFGLTIMSFLALTICIFLIFNSFSISLNQRWKEIGVLRAVGTMRAAIWLMFIGEAVVLGLIGSALGVIGGYFLARAAINVVTGVSATVYGVTASPGSLELEPVFALQAFIVGAVSSLIAAWLPARAAANLRPILALTNIETRQSEKGLSKLRIAVGLVLILVGLLLILFTQVQVGLNIQLFYLLFIQAGMILLLPMFIRFSAKVLRPMMAQFFGVEGVIAVESMAASPRRTVATVGALMIGLSFVIANGAFIQSQKAALDRSIDKALGGDFLVTSSDQLHSKTYHFSENTAAKIAALPGVAVSDTMRVASTQYAGEEVSLLAHNIDAYFAISPDLLDVGDTQTARDAVSRGDGALISTNLSVRTGLRLGDKIKIDSPISTVELPVVGILDYFRNEKGSILIDRELYKKYWNDSEIDYIFVNTMPDVDKVVFKRQIEDSLTGVRAFIYTHEEYKSWVNRLVDRFFTLTYLQIIIAILVAAVGLVNTMVISVAERRREIGIFRAVGGLRRQVAKMVMLEAASIGLIGLLTGMITGLLTAYFLVNTAAKVVAGYTIHLIFPYSVFFAAIPLVLIVAALSAFFPSYKAARIRVAEAIGYE